MRKVTFIQWLALSLLSVLAAFGFCFVNSGTVFAQPPDEETVTFPDPNLETVIRQAIGKRTGTIYISDVVALPSLSARQSQISNLTGLQYCTGLKKLTLDRNSINDISPLASLTKLEELYLSDNPIRDISPLCGLTNLEVLALMGNPIRDISPLGGLINLKRLYLSQSLINDISPLGGLTNLEVLYLSANRITDVSPLAGLTRLKGLDLNYNGINDILPMLSHGWPSGECVVDLNYNDLSADSVRFGIPLLRELGASVIYQMEIPPDWSFTVGSLIALAGAGLAPIYYLTARRPRKWLRPTALVMGVTGAVLLALWLLPAATWFGSFEVLSVPEGIAVFLGIVACLITLTSAAVGWRWELFGGVLLIVSGLIAGVVYPIWLFHTPSILTLFPLVSAFLYLLSWRERPRPTTVESMEKEPTEHLKERKHHDVLILTIVITGPIGFLGLLFFWSTFIGRSAVQWEEYFLRLLAEAWCLAFTCSILNARKYW